VPGPRVNRSALIDVASWLAVALLCSVILYRWGNP
jgi:hypothetical protein